MKISRLVATLLELSMAPLAWASPLDVRDTATPATSANSDAKPWTPVGAEPSGPDALQALVRGRLPDEMHDQFTFIIDPAVSVAGAYDAYQVDAQGAGVTIRSASTPGLSRGLLEYLRTLGGDIYWSGDTFGELQSPSTGNGTGKRDDNGNGSGDHNGRGNNSSSTLKGASWAEIRYLLNTVTHSYSLAFYDWDKWEYLLDWAALHGVTLPLATTATEYVWAAVYRDFGLTDDVILPYLTGPAFHAWGRFGNIHGSWGGTVSQDWLDKQWALQKRIVARMVAFGMTPVLSAFNGFVPRELHDKIGGPAFMNASRWVGFPDQYTRNAAIDATYPGWNVIQKAFLEKQQQLYGGWTGHYYNIPLFNELQPQRRDPAYLARLASGVIASLKQVDANPVWLIDGWMFVNDKETWTPANARAFLGAVPQDELLILDLASESLPQWSRTENYYGKRWVWNTLLNYGQNNGLYGALNHYSDQLTLARHTGGNLVGQGLTPEGINNNELMYELAMDAAWSTAQINVADWAKAFIQRRYGRLPPAAGDAVQRAWTLLLNSVYNSNDLSVQCTLRSIFDLVPSLDSYNNRGNFLATKTTYNTSDVVAALDLLLSAVDAYPALEQVPAFAYDLVDVARQVLLDAGRPMMFDMKSAWNRGDKAGVRAHGDEIVALLTDVDGVLGTNKNFLLSTWIKNARAWGADNATADFMEFEARNQIVLWGPGTNNPWLLDRYAAKHWHGVVMDVYAKGWDMYADYLVAHPPAGFNKANFTQSLIDYEKQWERRKWGNSPGETWGTVGTPVAAIKAARAKYAKWM